MPAFHAYRDKAIRAVDRVMAETVRLYPMRSGTADPGRDQAEFQAVARVGGEGSNGITGREDWSSRISSGEATVHIDRAAYTGPAIRKGDRVRLMDRVGQPWFDVLTINDRQHGRLVLHLGEA